MDAKSRLAAYNADQASRVGKYMTNAGAKAPDKYAQGGAVGGGKGKGRTNINIVIGKDKPDMAAPMPMAPKAPPVVLPPPGPPPMAGGAPPGGMPAGPPPGGAGLPGGLKLPGMKKGGAVGPMTAGSITGEGRLEKTANQAKHKGKA